MIKKTILNLNYNIYDDNKVTYNWAQLYKVY